MTAPDPAAPVAGTERDALADLKAEIHLWQGDASTPVDLAVLRRAAAEIARLRAEVAMLRKPAGETIGWDSETMAELVSARDQIASDRRCERRDECAASSAIFRDSACMRSAVQLRTPR